MEANMITFYPFQKYVVRSKLFLKAIQNYNELFKLAKTTISIRPAVLGNGVSVLYCSDKNRPSRFLIPFNKIP